MFSAWSMGEGMTIRSWGILCLGCNLAGSGNIESFRGRVDIEDEDVVESCGEPDFGCES
jgi:hypothetical protein